MRHAITIEDVKELFRDYEVQVSLGETDTSTVELSWPRTGQWVGKIFNPASRQMPLAPPGKLIEPSGVNFTRASSNVVLDLVSSEQFWRVTTTADQIHHFVLNFDGSKYGAVKTFKKKADTPFTIVFTSEQTARNFISLLQEPIHRTESQQESIRRYKHCFHGFPPEYTQ